MPTKNQIFSDIEENQIVEAIRLAEKSSSGEVRVHITQTDDDQPLDSTKKIFNELKMFNTKDRNAVLIHLSMSSKKFAIYGDEGIHAVVGDEFWTAIRDILLNHFQRGEIAQGLIEGIKEIGVQLKQHFPYTQEDINELSDEITYS